MCIDSDHFARNFVPKCCMRNHLSKSIATGLVAKVAALITPDHGSTGVTGHNPPE